MRVGDKLEKIYMHPATFVHVWIEMQFDLANINSKPVILKDVRVHYRIPPGWRVDATSPMSGSTVERRYVYSIELGTIAPGKFMHRKQGIGFEPPGGIIKALDKINLHTLNHNTYPISLTWQIDYQVDGKPGTKDGAGWWITRATFRGPVLPSDLLYGERCDVLRISAEFVRCAKAGGTRSVRSCSNPYSRL